MNLEHVINEALELNVIKDGDLKLPIDQVVVRNYDEVVGYAGRVRKPMIDWVTEYNYVSKESLTKEQFDKIPYFSRLSMDNTILRWNKTNKSHYT